MGLLPAVNLALQRDLGLRLTDLSVMTLAQSVAQALAAPVWGVLADRRVVRRKTLLALGALLQGGCTIALAFVDGFTAMMILRVFNGCMLASLKPLCVGLVADTTSETSRGRVYGYLQLCVTLGMMAAAMIGTPMSHRTIIGLPFFASGDFGKFLALRKLLSFSVSNRNIFLQNFAKCRLQGWRVAFILIGGFATFTAFLIKVFMHEARREKTWEPGSKKRGCDGFKEEMRKLGRLALVEWS